MRLYSIGRFRAFALVLAIWPTWASSQERREISIGLPSKSMVTAGPRIASELGLFEKHGLSARFIYLDSANGATSALIAKSVDFAQSGLAEAIAAQARGQKVMVVANSYAGLSGSLVVSKAVADRLGVSARAPITERLRALDGLLIASTSATSSFTFAYRGAANAAGANPRFTYMGLPAMGAALDSGAVQAMVATAPFYAFPVLKGTGVLWISAPKGELPALNRSASAANFQVMRDFADANPEVMKRFAAVSADLTAAIEQDPQAVKGALAKLYPELDAATLDLLYTLEGPALKVRRLTVADVLHEIAFVKSGGAQFPGIETVDPSSILLRQ